MNIQEKYDYSLNYLKEIKDKNKSEQSEFFEFIIDDMLESLWEDEAENRLLHLIKIYLEINKKRKFIRAEFVELNSYLLNKIERCKPSVSIEFYLQNIMGFMMDLYILNTNPYTLNMILGDLYFCSLEDKKEIQALLKKIVIRCQEYF